jgi:hypothetical protein
MHASITSTVLSVTEATLCLITVLFIFLRGQRSEYKALCLYLSCHAISDLLLLSLIVFATRGINAQLAYELYFYIYMVGFAIESILGLMLIYSVFNLAMAPLEGLKRLGTLIFRWAASISVAIALGSTLTPHITEKEFLAGFLPQLQRTQSILTLCLLLFVCFAIRPMGLTYRSRIFGVSLGLGVIATINLVSVAWETHFHNMYQSVDTVGGFLSCVVFMMWIAYFALPEPKRRMIVLPTTSPFLRWNQISQVLGDNPGFVAVGGIPPELFAPAELEVMRRASLKMADQPITSLARSQSA